MRKSLLAILAVFALGFTTNSSAFGSGPYLVLPNTHASSVTNYPLPPSKNEILPPTWIISGSNTQLHGPEGAATSNGSVFVADSEGFIFEFRNIVPGTNNIAPFATIAGGNTTLSFPIGLVIDKKGNLFVANLGGHSILEFASPAAGPNNVAPIATISGVNTLLKSPFGITLDKRGNVFVADDGVATIFKFAPPAPGANNVAPIAQISGGNTLLTDPLGIAVDKKGNIYVANEFVAVEKFAPPAPGINNVAPVATIPLNKDITGIGVDAKGHVFIADFGNNALLEFAKMVPGTNPAVPLATLSGPSYGIDGPELFTLGH